MIVNVGTGGAGTAEAVKYNNAESGLVSDNVQGALDEVNNNLGGLRFGVDGDGNYGYYGADDSLIPFKSGEFTLVASLYYDAFDGTIDGTNTWTADNDYDTLLVIKGGVGLDSTLTLTSETGTSELIQFQRAVGHYSVSASAWKLTDIKTGDIVALINDAQYSWFIFSI